VEQEVHHHHHYKDPMEVVIHLHLLHLLHLLYHRSYLTVQAMQMVQIYQVLVHRQKRVIPRIQKVRFIG
jgi:hypothetical protein